MSRLSDATLSGLPSAVRQPAYDRSQVRTGIVHLGIGNFHRAHQAVYTDEALEAGDLGWGITGASLRSTETRDALGPQDGLYAIEVKDGETDELRVIGSITRVLVAPEDPAALLAALVDPAIRIVTLTVTEKGYCHAPATGELDEAHPDIRHDLAEPGRPRSAPGFLVEALARRRAAGTAPFAVLSCDNLPANGRTTARVVARLAALRDPDLGRFVEREVAFPSSMVDRIVPATTEADRERISGRLGVQDAWPIATEPFTQWVIEDRFPAGRPDWAASGATFVEDVEPFELMKLRLLNGSHSTLAYLGYLAGHETVADAMADGGIAAVVRGLMDREAGPTLPALPGFDLDGYKASLIRRFRNPALRHRTWQIAMDGTQKLPQRLLATARERLLATAPIPLLALGVAAWMRYATGIDEGGREIDLRDPLAAELRARAARAGRDPEALARSLLELDQVFGRDLPADPLFVGPVVAALRRLFEVGASRAASEAARLGDDTPSGAAA